jgi:mono/diheme cytochrome c family protein
MFNKMILLCFAGLQSVPSAPALAGGDPDGLTAGKLLYAQNCASCHGSNLQGQAGWRRRLPSGLMPAPPHDETGHSWSHSDTWLFSVTKFGLDAVVGGGYQSDMPAFSDVLSDAEIRAVRDFIKAGWPQAQREVQAEITRKEAE